MRVPRFVGGGRIEWAEREVPAPGPGQLLLRVGANALCGSERGQFFGGSAVVPGHEAAGVVAAAGPDTAVAPGTPGVAYLMEFCGRCRNCRLGHTNLCLAKGGDLGFNRDGGYAPFEIVSERAFFPVPAEVPADVATLLLDAMGTSGHAIGRARRVREDVESVLITGAGPVGLGLLAMWRVQAGPDLPVYVSDVAPRRLALVERLGGTPVPVAVRTLADALAREGRGAVDVAFDASGRAEARQAAVAALGSRGVLVCVGHGQDVRLDVSRDLIGPERAVLGSEYFRYAELGENLPLLLAHRAYLAQILTHRFGPDDLPLAFEAFFGGETGKAVVVHPT
jgi:propanol-preferring alcohol dehydrogenase